METYALKEECKLKELVAAAQWAEEPIIVFDGEDECLVAMRPSVFERILFDTNLLNCSDRASLHF